MSQPPHETLEAALRSHTRAAEALARREADEGRESLRCLACAHRCLIRPGRSGVCKVRFNEAGELRVPFGYVANGVAIDPVEKKPFFHVLPGSSALSFGMLGCDMHCSYCQNWVTSQALRDRESFGSIERITPEELCDIALARGARVAVSTYNEPLITAEWSAAVFDACRPAGLVTGFVSNGNATREVLEYLRPRMDLYKVDLKGFRDGPYRKLGAVLANVLEGIRAAHELGYWVEVVTLVVPGHNDSDEELRDIARFLRGISRDIPWHVTAFHPQYRMRERTPTEAARVRRAREIGLEEGLRFVYTGNLHAGGRGEDTHCPGCDARLVARRGYRVRVVELDDEGRCGACGETIPGVWSGKSEDAG